MGVTHHETRSTIAANYRRANMSLARHISTVRRAGMCCTGCFKIQCAQHIYCPCINAVERRRLVASSFRLGTILGLDAGIALEQLREARGTPTEAMLQKLLDNSAVPEHIFKPDEITPGVYLCPVLA